MVSQSTSLARSAPEQRLLLALGGLGYDAMQNIIRRREFLAGVGASLLLPGCSRPTFDASLIAPLEHDFSYPLFTAPGRFALEAWEHLSSEVAGSESVVVAGSIQEFGYRMESLDAFPHEDIDEVLTLASLLDFPEGFRDYRREELDRVIAQMRADPNMAEFAGVMESEWVDGESAPLGDWPVMPFSAADSPGLSVATDVLTGRAYDEVVLAVFPTPDWTEIPAYMRFGGWNECPPDEWHVAALRYWRDQYGAQLVGMDTSVINVRVDSGPATRDEAIQLAREQFDYCADIVVQGVGNIAPLAAYLMHSDWWYFWWD